jgi:hypothetical protein
VSCAQRAHIHDNPTIRPFDHGRSEHHEGVAATLEGLIMTPQFLRSEAARFREMAEAVTDREASRQRLLTMAIDYDARAAAAEQAQPTPPAPSIEEPTPAPETEREPAAPEVAIKLKPGRRRLSL